MYLWWETALVDFNVWDGFHLFACCFFYSFIFWPPTGEIDFDSLQGRDYVGFPEHLLQMLTSSISILGFWKSLWLFYTISINWGEWGVGVGVLSNQKGRGVFGSLKRNCSCDRSSSGCTRRLLAPMLQSFDSDNGNKENTVINLMQTENKETDGQGNKETLGGNTICFVCWV